MSPLILTIMALNMIFFFMDMHYHYSLVKSTPWYKILVIGIIYLFIGFLSPLHSMYEYIKDSWK